MDTTALDRIIHQSGLYEIEEAEFTNADIALIKKQKTLLLEDIEIWVMSFGQDLKKETQYLLDAVNKGFDLFDTQGVKVDEVEDLRFDLQNEALECFDDADIVEGLCEVIKDRIDVLLDELIGLDR